MNNINHWRKLNRIRCVIGLSIDAVIIVCSYYGVMLGTMIPSDFSVGGFDIFKQFTVWSNLLIIFPTMLMIPYQVNGLLYSNYNPPKWLVVLQYVATVSLAQTLFVVSLLGVTTMGVENALWDGSNKYLHLIVPCFAILRFIFQNFEVKLHVKHAFVSIIPVTIYSIVYLVLSIFIGSPKGGWDDFYLVTTMFNWYITLPLFLLIAGVNSSLLLLVHNMAAKIANKFIQRSVTNEKSRTIEEAIAILAMRDYADDAQMKNPTLPVEVLAFMKKSYHSELSMREMCKLYIDTYMK